MRGIGLAIAAAVVLGCGGDKAAPPAPAGGGAPSSGLTAFETEHGIGPVKEPLTLGAPDHEMAEAGEEVFRREMRRLPQDG